MRALQPRDTCTSVWASPRSLAATQGIFLNFSSWSYLDGSVHSVRLHILYIQIWIPLAWWVSPFGNLRVNARLTAIRSFSQPSTSFFAFNRQGIRHIHLKFYLDSYFSLQNQSWLHPTSHSQLFNEQKPFQVYIKSHLRNLI